MSNIKCYHIVKLTFILKIIKASRISLRESKKAYPHHSKLILVFFSAVVIWTQIKNLGTPLQQT